MMFATYNLSSAQILVTEGDVDDPDTLRQVRDTTAELLFHADKGMFKLMGNATRTGIKVTSDGTCRLSKR